MANRRRATGYSFTGNPSDVSGTDNGPTEGGDSGASGITGVSGGEGGADIDPSQLERDNPSGEPIQRLNKDGTPRKRRSRKATSAQKAAIDLSGLESLLYSVHVGLATVAKVPELMLSEQEASTLAKASANVMRHYDVGASQKAFDWAHLTIALTSVYGTRIVAISARKKADKDAEENPPQRPNLMAV